MTAALQATTLSPVHPDTGSWHTVCRLDDLITGRGVAALLGGAQIAIFLLWDGRIYAVGNYDPHGRAYVISRGLVGSRGEAPVVASPLYKHAYDLRTGHCLDTPDGPTLPTYPARVHDGAVQIQLP